MIKCPIDGRQFPSAAALAQHRRDSHAAGKPAASKRRPRPPKQRVERADGLMPRMSSTGVDLISSITLPSSTAIGTVIMNLPLGPSSLTPSRWRNESALWSRWRPRSLKVSVVGSGASTTFGSICVAWCPDNTWTPSGGSHDFMRVAALRPSVTMRLHESRVLTIPNDTLTKWYLCDGNIDLSSHGCVLAVVASPTGGYRGACGVTITLQWSVDFEGIEMPGESSAISDTISPDSGYSTIFTTSDGSFDATKLTFKMHSGGEMVPFSSARIDHVYEPVSPTEVKYYDSASRLQVCQWFARVQGITTPGLLLFATRQDALDYISSGALVKALTYYAAGPYVTPARPVFKGTPAKPLTDELAAVSTTSPSVVSAFFRGVQNHDGDIWTRTWNAEDYSVVFYHFDRLRDDNEIDGRERPSPVGLAQISDSDAGEYEDPAA